MASVAMGTPHLLAELAASKEPISSAVHALLAVQAKGFTEFRCKADAAQLVRAGGGAPSRTVDNRCWARSGHSISQACASAAACVLH